MPAAVLRRMGAELRGILCMSGAAASSAGMNGLVRDLSTGLHAFEIAFFRNLFGFAFLVPALLRHGPTALATNRLPLHFLRGLLNAVAMLSFFYAVTVTPLATVAALAFTSPLFATLLAIVILREKVGPRRWFGLFIGLAGALLIIRPGFAVIDTGALMVLLSSMAWGAALVIIKLLGRTESSLVTTSYAALFLLPITGITAIFVWQTPDGLQLVKLVAIGALGSLTQLGIAQAFRKADASLVLPFDFTKLVWAAVIGYAAFDEIPDPIAILGGAIICSAVTYIAYRESQVARLRTPTDATVGQ